MVYDVQFVSRDGRGMDAYVVLAKQHFIVHVIWWFFVVVELEAEEVARGAFDELG